MDLISITFYLFISLIIVFVFVFILGNMYLDLQQRLILKKNRNNKKLNKIHWWGDMKKWSWWKSFFKKNEKINKHYEGMTNARPKTFDNNDFNKIILPDIEDYDLEIAIPMDQKIYGTVQGNWGFRTDENGVGFCAGVYRDGYSGDGCIFKGRSEKRFKFLLERGPYTIRYEVRKNNNKHQDVKIFINNKEVMFVKNEGVNSGKIKFIGTNEPLLNKLTDSNSRGRRPLDYLKFIPKTLI